MSSNLISFADYQALTGLVRAETEYPDFALVRDLVTARIEDFLGRKLEQATSTETVFFFSPQLLPLRRLPVFTVSSVQIDDQVLPQNAYQAVPWGLYLIGYTLTPGSGQQVLVQYQGGYAAEDLPVTLKRAALYQTKFELDNKSQIAAESLNTSAGSLSRPSFGLLPEVQASLFPYRHPYFYGGLL